MSSCTNKQTSYLTRLDEERTSRLSYLVQQVSWFTPVSSSLGFLLLISVFSCFNQLLVVNVRTFLVITGLRLKGLYWEPIMEPLVSSSTNQSSYLTRHEEYRAVMFLTTLSSKFLVSSSILPQSLPLIEYATLLSPQASFRTLHFHFKRRRALELQC